MSIYRITKIVKGHENLLKRMIEVAESELFDPANIIFIEENSMEDKDGNYEIYYHKDIIINKKEVGSE